VPVAYACLPARQPPTSLIYQKSHEETRVDDREILRKMVWPSAAQRVKRNDCFHPIFRGREKRKTKEKIRPKRNSYRWIGILDQFSLNKAQCSLDHCILIAERGKE